MSIVSAIETVGDISGIAKGGANREATDKELAEEPMLMELVALLPVYLVASKHVFQPKCWFDINDRRNESISGNIGSLIPCRLWAHSKGWCGGCRYANIRAWRRCHSYVGMVVSAGISMLQM